MGTPSLTGVPPESCAKKIKKGDGGKNPGIGWWLLKIKRAGGVFNGTAFDCVGVNHDGLIKSRISDGFVKSPRSRLANPEE
ncbi:hypothetical protein DESC_700157 [Desulfosarcina cetonica]|nr:hypothetical protein DESC_700157 [Desulfosarcina cetonica]